MNEIFHLLETLVKMRVFLINSEGKAKSIETTEDIEHLKGTFINQSNIDGKNLNEFKSSWMKYNCYLFKKPLELYNKSYKVRNILHLIHSAEPDIIIARVVKFSKKDNKYLIRYIIFQKNKEQVCSNIVEMNNVLKNSFNYDGRELRKKDFDIITEGGKNA